MPMNRGKEKEDVVHIYKGKLAIKSTETPSFAEVWIDLETIIRSEVRKANIVYYLLYVESRKMLEMNQSRRQTQMQRTNMDTKEGGWCNELGDGEWHRHTTMYKTGN